MDLVEFIQPYLGAPYSNSLWKALPSPQEVYQHGCSNVGLLNLFRLWDGQPAFISVGHTLWEVRGKVRDIVQELPFGALLLRFPREPLEDGHCAVVLENQTLLHCHSSSGLTIDDSWQTSHRWRIEGYYDAYVRLEDWLPHPCRCVRGQHSCAPK